MLANKLAAVARRRRQVPAMRRSVVVGEAKEDDVGEAGAVGWSERER